MTPKRWDKVNRAGEGLFPEEIATGWHFCADWDLLLVGPDMKIEWDCCHCTVFKDKCTHGKE